MTDYRSDLNGIFNGMLQHSIINIAEKGAIGTIQDITKWLAMFTKLAASYNIDPPKYLLELNEQEIEKEIENLKAQRIIEDTGKGYQEYQATKHPLFQIHNQIRYSLIGDLSYSPLQLIRSRLESYLTEVGVNRDDITDISIGVIEAAENAVKYGDGGIVKVSYTIDKNLEFHITMENPIKAEPVEQNIEDGKFSEGFTLMRGIMAIDKLFDQFDLDRDDTNKVVVFTARKKIHIDNVAPKAGV